MRLIDADEAMRQMANSRQDLSALCGKSKDNEGKCMEIGINLMHDNAIDIVNSLAENHCFNVVRGLWVPVIKRLQETEDYDLRQRNKRADKENAPRWILVSEKMPETNGKDGCINCLVCTENGYITIGKYFDDTGVWFFLSHSANDSVIAWLPLPEPYEAEN